MNKMNIANLKKALLPFIQDNLEYLKDLYPEDEDNVIVNRVVNECATEKLLSAVNKKFKVLPVTKMAIGTYSLILDALEDESEMPSDFRCEIVPKLFDFPICFTGSERISCGFGNIYHSLLQHACISCNGESYTVESYEITDDEIVVKTFIRSEKSFYNFDNFRKYFPKKYFDYLFEI